MFASAVHRPRVVSLVPSLTEVVAASGADLLVGVTDWCSHPPDLSAARVGGTKNPRIDDIVALHPDLVLVNTEENRAPDLDRLRDSGLELWVTDYKTVPDAIVGLAAMIDTLGLGRPRWIDDAAQAWAEPWTGPTIRALVPIWRRPWMALGRDTFAGDLLARIGVVNVLSGHQDRYPKIEPADAPPYDIAILPDEPYRFTADDGPESFAVPSRLVSGRHLTWYGPSLAEARSLLRRQIWGD